MIEQDLEKGRGIPEFPSSQFASLYQCLKDLDKYYGTRSHRVNKTDIMKPITYILENEKFYSKVHNCLHGLSKKINPAIKNLGTYIKPGLEIDCPVPRSIKETVRSNIDLYFSSVMGFAETDYVQNKAALRGAENLNCIVEDIYKAKNLVESNLLFTAFNQELNSLKKGMEIFGVNKVMSIDKIISTAERISKVAEEKDEVVYRIDTSLSVWEPAFFGSWNMIR